MSRFLNTVFIIARSAFQDLLRERILYNLFFVSLFMLFFGYLAALLVFGHQDRVMLHFGMMANAVSIYLVATGAGSRNIRHELDQRTAYLTLSRPVSRVSYYYGKVIGISLFAAINLSLLMALLAGAVQYTGGEPNIAFLQAGILIWCESTIVIALSLLLSLFLRPGLATMATLAYLFVSHNHDQLSFLQSQSSGEGGLFALLQFLTPRGHLLLLDTRVYYDLPLTLIEFIQRMGYGFSWSMVFILMGSAVFYRKNL